MEKNYLEATAIGIPGLHSLTQKEKIEISGGSKGDWLAVAILFGFLFVVQAKNIISYIDHIRETQDRNPEALRKNEELRALSGQDGVELVKERLNRSYIQMPLYGAVAIFGVYKYNKS